MNYQNSIRKSSATEDDSFKCAEVLYSTADSISNDSEDLFNSYLLESRMAKMIAEDRLRFLLQKDNVSIKSSFNDQSTFDIAINDSAISPDQRDLVLADIVEAIREAN